MYIFCFIFIAPDTNTFSSDSSWCLKGHELELSDDPEKKVQELSDLLRVRTNYEEGERGAAKSYFPADISSDVNKNTPTDFPPNGATRMVRK